VETEFSPVSTHPPTKCHPTLQHRCVVALLKAFQDRLGQAFHESQPSILGRMALEDARRTWRLVWATAAPGPGQILESASVLGMCFAALAPSKLNTTQAVVGIEIQDLSLLGRAVFRLVLYLLHASPLSPRNNNS
jgi:hypothetical protein